MWTTVISRLEAQRRILECAAETPASRFAKPRLAEQSKTAGASCSSACPTGGLLSGTRF